MISNDILRGNAIKWIKTNTHITEPESEEWASATELFVAKYSEVMNIPLGVSSESISGMSQSFNNSLDVKTTLLQLAREIFGDDNVKSSDVKAFPFVDRWVY